MTHIFLDANIIIGLLYEKDRIHTVASQTVHIALKHYHCYISPITLAIAHHKIKKLVSNKAERERANQLILSTFHFSSITTTTMEEIKMFSAFHDLEDALQYYSARTINPVGIVTEDAADFAPYSQIPIYTPYEFIQLKHPIAAEANRLN